MRTGGHGLESTDMLLCAYVHVYPNSSRLVSTMSASCELRVLLVLHLCWGQMALLFAYTTTYYYIITVWNRHACCNTNNGRIASLCSKQDWLNKAACPGISWLQAEQSTMVIFSAQTMTAMHWPWQVWLDRIAQKVNHLGNDHTLCTDHVALHWPCHPGIGPTGLDSLHCFIILQGSETSSSVLLYD